jgi:superfamily II DNA/RNA helicase
VHRVGRTGRAAATGDAFTFVSPQEEADLRRIERAIGRRLPRVTVPGFEAAAGAASSHASAPSHAPAPRHARRGWRGRPQRARR